MFNTFDDQFIDDVVLRSEQSRVSYDSQREEFHNLNESLQTYLNDIKTIDLENRQLQENIDNIRQNYVLQLENHLKCLLKDFTELSRTLTQIHAERYQYKVRARRFINERAEYKRRINFAMSYEKEQTKRFNILQKKERTLHHECTKLNEQFQQHLNYVENEKQTHRLAMNKVDDLHSQLEQICVARSKTEFEIQTLKEEITLMQTAKCFLDEEREGMVSSTNEANEYFLSFLNESIVHIREDFNQVNEKQLQQVEDEYKQMLQVLEEHLITNGAVNDRLASDQQSGPLELKNIEDEYQASLQELIALNTQNQTLSNQLLAMEADFCSLREEHMQSLTLKNDEIENSKITLMLLKNELNHLAEYDRNLKFELALYRGVLENDYHRSKRYKYSSTNTDSYLHKPTTLLNTNNSMTDETILLTTNANQNRLDDQNKEILTTGEKVRSNGDRAEERVTVSNLNYPSTKDSSQEQKSIDEKHAHASNSRPYLESQDNDNINSEDAQQSVGPLLTANLSFDREISSDKTREFSSDVMQTTLETRKSSTSSTTSSKSDEKVSLLSERRWSATPSEQRSLPAVPITKSDMSPTEKKPSSVEIQQPSMLSTTVTLQDNLSLNSQDCQTPTYLKPTLPTPSTDDIVTSSLIETPSWPTAVTLQDNTHIYSDYHESFVVPSEVPTQASRRSSAEIPETSRAVQSSASSSIDPTNNQEEMVMSSQSEQQLPLNNPQQTAVLLSDVEDTISSSTAEIMADKIQFTSDLHEPILTTDDNQSLSRRSSFELPTAFSDNRKRSSTTDTPITFDLQKLDSEEQKPQFMSQEQCDSSRNDAPNVPKISSSNEEISSSSTTTPHTFLSMDLHDLQEPSIPTSADISSLPSDIESSSDAIKTIEHQQTDPDLDTPSSIVIEEQQSTSRRSSSNVPNTMLQSISAPDIATATEDDQSLLESHQSRSESFDVEQPVVVASIIESKEMISNQYDDKLQLSPPGSPKTTTAEFQQVISDIHEAQPKYFEELQVLEHQSSEDVETSFDAKNSLSTKITTESGQSNSDVNQISPALVIDENSISRRSSSDVKYDIQESSSLPSVPPPSTTTEHEQFDLPTHTRSSSSSQDLDTTKDNSTTTQTKELESADSEAYQPPISDAMANSTGNMDMPVLFSLPIIQITRDDDEELSGVPSPSDKQESTAVTYDEDTNLPTVIDHNLAATSADGEFNTENQAITKMEQTDEIVEHEQSTPSLSEPEKIHETRDDQLQEEFNGSLDTTLNMTQSLILTPIDVQQDQIDLNSSQSNFNVSLDTDNRSELKQEETLVQSQREENTSSSLASSTEVGDTTNSIVLTTTNIGSCDDATIPSHDTRKRSSIDATTTENEEVTTSTSQKVLTTLDNTDDQNQAAIMQDLRSIFYELANREGLVEIGSDLPDKLLDRLGFHDCFVRILFDSFLRKYLVQSVTKANRPDTLDWNEFRDILFPIVTGRYTERHVRILFDLFDTNKVGYLSLHEIADLLEILQANNTVSLAQNIINQYDTDHDGKLSADEFIEAIRTARDIAEHVLTEETENKELLSQVPAENQTILSSTSIQEERSSLKTNDECNQELILLGSIFRNVGAQIDTKQLHIINENLSLQLTNEFIRNNINLLHDDLLSFIQLYLDKKRQTDLFLGWNEFRDTFIPIINKGHYSKIDIQKWFDVFDIDHTGTISREQVIRMLRLLHIDETDNVMKKFEEVTNRDDATLWTLDQIMHALVNVAETLSRLRTNNEQYEQLTSFNLD